MPLFDHFGFIAPFYDRVIQMGSPEKLISLADLPIDGSLLDAGGGTGRVSQALKGYVQRLVIADLSYGMLQQANLKNGFHTVCSHTELLPFPDESFDRVIMIDALHHVCDYVTTAKELWRVVKIGGRIVFQEPDIRTITIKFVALAEKLALMRSKFVSPPNIAALFEYPNATTRIERENYNAWVVVEKGKNAD